MKQVRGEVGILRFTLSNPISNKCFLVIEHDGERFVGTLMFSDNKFCQQIMSLLQKYIGRPIKEIGGLDVSYTL